MDEMASTSLMYDIHPSLHSYLYEGVFDKFQVLSGINNDAFKS
jgi:hypothetical protein